MEINNVVGYAFNNRITNGIRDYIGNHKLQTGLVGLASLVIGVGAVDYAAYAASLPPRTNNNDYFQRRIETIKNAAPWFNDGSVSKLEAISAEPLATLPCDEFLGKGLMLGKNAATSIYTSPTGHEITIEGSPEFVDAYFKALKWSEQFPNTHRYINQWINCVIQDVRYTGDIAAATNDTRTKTAFISRDVGVVAGGPKYTYNTEKDTLIRLTSLLAHEGGWIEYDTNLIKIENRLYKGEGYVKATEREVEALEEMGAKEDLIESNRKEIRDCIKRVQFWCK